MGDTPPPPYDDIVTREENRIGGEPPVRTGGAPPTFTARLMPLEFNVYSESATSSDLYFMGPHQKDRQFALTFHINSFAQIPKPSLILHDGLTKRDPAIATATNGWIEGTSASIGGGQDFLDKFIINAPRPTGSSSPTAEEPLVVIKTGTYWHPVIAMRYSVQVAAGGSSSGRSERQEFEWQESSSSEVLSLGGERSGWRLVALTNASETLAVCATNGGSLTKFFRFAFRGKGRAADCYGLTWEVMAVITGLTTWARSLEINRSMG